MRHFPALAAVAVLAIAAPAAHAAYPASGTVTAAKPAKWAGQAAGGTVNVIEAYASQFCDQPFCDVYTLTVPETGLLTLKITATVATGFTYTYVTDPDGYKQKYKTGSGEPVLTITIEDATPGNYKLETYTNTVPLVTSGDYNGRATLAVPPVG